MNKTQLRKHNLTWRLSLSEADWASKSNNICSRLAGMDLLQSAKTVHAFWPIHSKQEVDIYPLLLDLVSSGKKVFLPIMVGLDLKYGLFGAESDLQHVGFGVKEPTKQVPFIPDEIDIVLVPALAADLVGNRIGYGKGFYDRFLAKCTAVKIVPLFENQVVDGIPSEVHDVPVDILVTEQRIHRVRSTKT